MNSNTRIQRDPTRARVGLAALLALPLLLTLGACDAPGGDASHRVNGSVHIAATQPLGSAETVNGSIHVDADAKVSNAATVNGSIQLGARASAASAKTVNGDITLEAGAHVAGDVVAVNGGLSLREGADVSGGVRNVSGSIELQGAHVGGRIGTVAGNVTIQGPSRVDGGLLVQRPSGISFVADLPRIVIGPGARVDGELKFERDVQLFVSEQATVGTVIGATPVRFSGDAPPK
ncbi:MAG: hypothetical protein JSR54_01125 [Proteobacteria bacterium]|nr:hypothetical protein [Pseudomonadota bacterium]